MLTRVNHEKSIVMTTSCLYIIAQKITFDPLTGLLSTKEKTLRLSYRESTLLTLFISQAGEVIVREYILGHVWEGKIVTDASLAKIISILRKALKKFGIECDAILTIPREGYRFLLDVYPISRDRISQTSSEDIEKTQEIKNKIAVHSRLGRTKWTLIIIIVSALFGTFFDVLLRGRENTDSDFIHTGYAERQMIINGKSYRFIGRKTPNIALFIQEFISKLPEGSTIFYDELDGDINLSFVINDGVLLPTQIVNSVEKLTK